MKKLIVFWMLCFVIFTGCAEKEALSLPFSPSDIESTEMFRYIVPSETERKIITDVEETENIAETISRVKVKKSLAEQPAGSEVLKIRFNLNDGTDFTVTYISCGVKDGILIVDGSPDNYRTSSDIGALWNIYDHETEVLTAPVY